MQDLIRQVLALLGGMWKFRWIGLAVAWVVAVLGAVVAMKVPNQYEASARIFVDTQSILKPLMQGLAIQPNVDQQVAMLSRTLISRPNLEKLVRMADLDLKSATKADQEALIERLGRTVAIRSTGRDNLYSLSYRDADSERAKRVIQSMVSIFVETSLGSSRKDTDAAKTFLDEQIKAHEARLEEAEAKLKEFKIRNIDLQNADGRDSAAQLAQINQQLTQARLELREAENSRDAAKQQIQAEKEGKGVGAAAMPSLLPVPGAAADAMPIATPEIDARILAQKRNLDTLQQRFTDQHPDVAAARRLIAELEQQRQKEVEELRKAAAIQAAQAAAAAASGAAVPSPASAIALQELNRLLGAAELQVAALKARVAEYASRLQRGKEAMKTAPQLEAEAAQLNRDYGIIKRNYENLVARRQSAQMSGELEVASGVADFRLIDPPRVDPKPVSPNRPLLVSLALVAALLAGLFVPFVLAQMRPVFDGVHELRMRTSLPVLGVVSMLTTAEDQRRAQRRRWGFLAGSGGLVGVYLIGLAWLTLFATRQAG